MEQNIKRHREEMQSLNEEHEERILEARMESEKEKQTAKDRFENIITELNGLCDHATVFKESINNATLHHLHTTAPQLSADERHKLSNKTLFQLQTALPDALRMSNSPIASYLEN